MKRVFVATAFVLTTGAGFAAAQSVGSVTSISGEEGTVIVQRGTETYSLDADEQVFPGDKITVRAGGSVEITAYGCTVMVPSAASITVDAEFCTTTPITLASEPVTPPDPVVAAGEGGNTGLLIGAGVLGVSAIAAAAAGGGGGDSPASP